VYTSSAMKQLSITAVLLLCPALYAQDRVAAAIDSLPSVKSIDQVAISPDGLQVAYIVAGELFVAPVPNGPSHRVAPNRNAAREVTWSVDSHQLAWLNDLPGDKPASQLWSASADGSEVTQRVTFQGYAQSPRYSPDGKTISVLYIEGMPRVAGPLVAGLRHERRHELLLRGQLLHRGLEEERVVRRLERRAVAQRDLELAGPGLRITCLDR